MSETKMDHIEAVVKVVITSDAFSAPSAVLRQGAWAESARVLPTIKHVGLLTTAWLLVLTLTVQAGASPAAAVADAGLAPRLRESGRSVRGRPQLGAGNQRLRTAV